MIDRRGMYDRPKCRLVEVHWIDAIARSGDTKELTFDEAPRWSVGYIAEITDKRIVISQSVDDDPLTIPREMVIEIKRLKLTTKYKPW